ncbi:CBS domain-containing protein [Pseudorhodoferax soli]|uniref:CBS domain protein n=1 Tax=Pseudorhodoferax soli TaxID=545864 RepID=A0A368XYD0_9BURK|nr:CBS domain-containing protein [Pseudorhodoferax soli]RCW72982.1 CBS domain protein [Pseudorhodoferax soli]
MFSVYGVTGRQFTGSAEQLRQIERVNAAARTRRIDPNEDVLPERVSADPTLNTPLEPVAVPAAGTTVARRTALAAYAQTGAPETQRQPLTRVAEIMHTPAFTLPENTTVLQAWRLLAYHGYAQAPVVSASGMLVGLLLRADLLPPERMAVPDLAQEGWAALMAQPVSELMWTPVPSTSADNEIRRVAAVLHEDGLPGLPVVDDAGAVVGFVSRSDIVRAVAHEPPLDLWS